MLVEGLEVSLDKMGGATRRIVDRAIDESRRREHPLLATDHMVLAFAQVEWDRFAQIMRDIDLDAQTILRALETFQQPATWRQLIQRGMRQDFSWTHSAAEYVQLYKRIAHDATTCVARAT